jgi:spore coat polysaccharide biosynthesis protein SpsF
VTALVLQARLDSTRLPGKSMLPLGGRPLIFRVMEAFAFSPWEEKILACPEDCVSSFAPLALECGFTIIAGPKEDVLARYCLAVRRCGADRVVRATGDNPFVFVDAAGALNREALDAGADYAAYSGLPLGAGVESIASEALLRAEREAVSPMEREHVCPYLYGHEEIFKVYRPPAPAAWQGPDLRLTIDTHEDYEKAQTLYRRLCFLPRERRNLGENIISVLKGMFTEDSASGETR